MEVNGENLLNKSNVNAMEILRSAMQKDGNIPGFISVVVARRKGSATAHRFLTGTVGREVRVSQTDLYIGDNNEQTTLLKLNERPLISGVSSGCHASSLSEALVSDKDNLPSCDAKKKGCVVSTPENYQVFQETNRVHTIY